MLTEPENGTNSTMISVPSGAVANSFINMVTTKMQPLWAARSELRIDNGTSVELTSGEVAAVRVGELRVTVGQGAGKIRGVVVELRMRDDEDEEDEVDVAVREAVLRAALDATFRGSGVNVSNAKLLSRITLKTKEGIEQGEVVRVYSELMRVAAPVTQR